MAKTVVYNTVVLEGADVQVDAASQAIALRARYHLAASATGEAAGAKQSDVAGLLTQQDREFILGLADRLRQGLEAMELA
jgi:hypothetical protein